MDQTQIKPYLAEQIKYEEQYHDWLKIMLANALTVLLDSVKNGNYSYPTLKGVLTDYKARYYHIINAKSREVATSIVNIADRALSKPESATVSTAALKAISFNNMSQQINGGVELLLDQVLARVVSLIPFGFAGLYANLYNDETNERDLYVRTNNSSMKYARDVYTEGVFNSIINLGSLYGYSEYAADNKHDSRVRPMHAKYFVPTNWIKFDDPPPCGHVGTQSGCRCEIVALR